jgi:hypothetical protein
MGSSANAVSDLEREEHDAEYGTKKVSLWGYDESIDPPVLKRMRIDDVDYTMILDQTDPNNIYQAWATPGTLTSEAKWKIRRINTTGGVKTMAYSDGNTNFDNVFENRGILNFS